MGKARGMGRQGKGKPKEWCRQVGRQEEAGPPPNGTRQVPGRQVGQGEPPLPRPPDPPFLLPRWAAKVAKARR